MTESRRDAGMKAPGYLRAAGCSRWIASDSTGEPRGRPNSGGLGGLLRRGLLGRSLGGGLLRRRLLRGGGLLLGVVVRTRLLRRRRRTRTRTRTRTPTLVARPPQCLHQVEHLAPVALARL